MPKPDALQDLKEAEPYLRSAVALLLFLRFGPTNQVTDCYKTADKFIAQLKEDIQYGEV